MGYSRAGFEVVGVDIVPQPNYPFTFIQADALEYVREWIDTLNVVPFAAIHASPPCQAHVKGLRAMNRTIGRTDEHRDLIGDTRALLKLTGLPWVLENVVGSELVNPVRLCGSAFGLPIRRHRLFESNVSLMVPPCAHGVESGQKYWNGDRSVRNGDGTRSYTGHGRLSSVVQIYGHSGGRDEWPAALGIDWMTDEEMVEAIPPVYTELIGAQLLDHLLAKAAA
jgi:DNA (cytosine-5)-methyltransferase 1